MRQVYRIELSGSFHLRGILHLPDSPDAEGRLSDISAKGAGLVFLPGSDPKLELGQELTMSFEGPNGIKLETDACVRSCVQQDDFVRYGFEFTEFSDKPSEVPFLMRAVFNRRRSPRVEPQEPVSVEIEQKGGEKTEAKLINISVTGAAFEVDFVDFESFKTGTEVVATFSLPGSASSLHLAGVVRDCRMNGPSVHIGFEFFPEKIENYELQLEFLENYISTREIETPFIPG